jgi:hypothetical protein
MDLDALRSFNSNKSEYRNRGSKRLSQILLDLYDEKQKPVEDIKPTVEQPEMKSLISSVPVVVPVIEKIEVPKIETVEPVVVEPVVVEQVKVVTMDPIEQIIEKSDDSDDSIAMSTDCGTEISMSGQELVKVGSYTYSQESCPRCLQKRKQLYDQNIIKNGVVVTQYRYFEITCDKCTKQKFSDYKKNISDTKQLNKVLDKQETIKAVTKTTDDKIAQLQRLKTINKDPINKEAFRKDLKRNVEGQSQFNLHLHC